MSELRISGLIMQENMLFFGKKFTLPPVVTLGTNLTSVFGGDKSQVIYRSQYNLVSANCLQQQVLRQIYIRECVFCNVFFFCDAFSYLWCILFKLPSPLLSRDLMGSNIDFGSLAGLLREPTGEETPKQYLHSCL